MLCLCREKLCARGIEAHFPSDYRDQEFRRGVIVSSHIITTLPLPPTPCRTDLPHFTHEDTEAQRRRVISPSIQTASCLVMFPFPLSAQSLGCQIQWTWSGYPACLVYPQNQSPLWNRGVASGKAELITCWISHRLASMLN